MRRKTFDALMATGGLAIAAVLLIAGVLLTWGHSFATGQVRSQLAAQKIYFPATGDAQMMDAKIAPYLRKYAGQQLTTGPQAKAFADHYIAVHLETIGGGKTYSQLSTESLANPTDTALAAKVQTVFRGETLRGMLLNAYAFWKLGEIALIAAVAAFAGAGVMFVLALGGFWHLRRTDTAVELAAPRAGRRVAPGVA